MKRLLAILLLSCPLWSQIQVGVLAGGASGGGGGATGTVTLVQAPKFCSAASCAFTSNLTAGNTACAVGLSYNTPTTNTAKFTGASDGTNTYTETVGAYFAIAGVDYYTGTQLFCSTNVAGGAATITLAGTITFPGMYVFELHASVGTAQVDAVNGQTQSAGSRTVSTGSVTSTVTNDFAMSFFAADGFGVTTTAGTGWTAGTQATVGGVAFSNYEYRSMTSVATVTGDYAPAASASGVNAGFTVAFKSQ